MTLKIDLTPQATWRRSFHQSLIHSCFQAVQRPERLLVAHTGSGVRQWYLFDLNTSDLRQLTFGVRGTPIATLSADGDTLYYLEDTQGNGIGHLFRCAVEGGTPVDLTPDWPAYTSFLLAESASGNYLGFMALNQMGFQMFVMDTHSGSVPHLRYETEALSNGPFLSYDGEIAVIASMENEHWEIESYDVKTEALIQRFKHLYGVTPHGFIPRANDMRVLMSVIRHGYERPCVWNARTGDRRDLELGNVTGDVASLDWSENGETLLYRVTGVNGQRVYRYSFSSGQTTPLPAYDDRLVREAYSYQNELLVLIEDEITPPQLQRAGQPVLVLARENLLADRPITRRAQGRVVHYEQPGDTHVIQLAVQQEQPSHTYDPSLVAWLDAGATVTSISSLLNPGMMKLNESASASILAERSYFAAQVKADDSVFGSDDRRRFFVSRDFGATALLLNAAVYEQLAAGIILYNPFVAFRTLRTTLSEAEQTLLNDLLGDATGNYNNVSLRHLATKIQVPLLVIYDTDSNPINTDALKEWVKLLKARRLEVQVHTCLSTTPNLHEQVQAWMMTWVGR